MKVLVTGGAGYIGAQLVFELAKNIKITEVIVYDNLVRKNFNLFISVSNKINNDKVKFVHGDLLDSRSLNAAMKDVQIVYHLAAVTNSGYKSLNSDIFEQTNHWGTAEVVYAAEEAGTVKQFIYASSTGVYQGGKDNMCDENSTLNPRDYYSISKMRGEEHVARLQEKMNAKILRIGNVYGYSPSIRFDSVINKFLFDAQFNGRISIHGSGKQIRPFIHINKVINVMTSFVDKDTPSGYYNISDKNLKILDLVDVFKEVYPELEFIFINQHIDMKNLQIADNAKIKEFVNLPESDLKDEVIKFRENNFSF